MFVYKSRKMSDVRRHMDFKIIFNYSKVILSNNSINIRSQFEI